MIDIIIIMTWIVALEGDVQEHTSYVDIMK